jgi:hypothetical protein
MEELKVEFVGLIRSCLLLASEVLIRLNLLVGCHSKEERFFFLLLETTHWP